METTSVLKFIPTVTPSLLAAMTLTTMYSVRDDATAQPSIRSNSTLIPHLLNRSAGQYLAKPPLDYQAHEGAVQFTMDIARTLENVNASVMDTIQNSTHWSAASSSNVVDISPVVPGEDDYYGPNFYYNFVQLWAIAAVIVALTLITIGGNLVVLIVFLGTKELRKVSNSFVLSLAMADLLIGCLMPIAMIMVLRGLWPFGTNACKAYLTFFFFWSDASMLSILTISIDRWWSIHKPFQYRVKQNPKRAAIVIICAWSVAFLLYGPAIMAWEGVTGNPAIGANRKCEPPFRHSVVFSMSAGSMEFILPMILLVYCNLSIYLKISKRKDKDIGRNVSVTALDFLHLTTSRKSSSSDIESLNMEELASMVPKNSDKGERTPENTFTPTHKRRFSLATRQPMLVNHERSDTFPQRSQSSRRVSFDAVMLPNNRRHSSTSKMFARRQSVEIVRDMLTKQDRKAARALGFLVLAFIVCWAPYIALRMLRSVYPCCISEWAIEGSKWLMLANSGINPFIYAVGNKKFRRRVLTFLALYRHRRRSVTQVGNGTDLRFEALPEDGNEANSKQLSMA